MVSEVKGRSQKNSRILVVGKDEGSRETVLAPLRWEQWDVRGVSSGEEAVALFENWRPQIVILDLEPGERGTSWLNEFRHHLPHAAILYLSDDSTTESIIDGLDRGADDYIVKPFVPLELLARLRTQLRVRDLQEQLIYANEKLKELVDIDDLTGLFNMRSLYQRLEFEMERARRFGRDVCVIMMDMDNFKSVNDGHDHLFGSFVLSEVGKIIKNGTRNIDIPARYGGDEFLVVLSEVNEEGAGLFCERIRKAIEGHVFSSGEDSIRLTISIGYSMLQADDTIVARDFVRQADHALYEAKRTGRNKVCSYGAKNNVRPIKPPAVAKKSAGKMKKASGDR